MSGPMRRCATAAALAATAALAGVSLLPGGPAAPGGWDRSVSPGLQNLLHVPAYAVLTVLWLWALRAARAFPVAVLVAAACAAYGAALEGAQAFIAGRTGSLADALLNAAGAAAGLVLFLLIARGRPRPSRAGSARRGAEGKAA
jgi:VanZ family protein